MRISSLPKLLSLSMVFMFILYNGLIAQTGDPEKLVLHTEEQFQQVVGFGAALAYYESWLNAHPNKGEIYQAIFGELSLDILRVRNAYDYDPQMVERVQEYVQVSETILGSPIPVLTTSWGPPGYLKNTGDRKNGGTLRYTTGPGGVEFDYAGFAHWWGASLDEYESHGIYPEYISIQNEPDWSADYESCLLRPLEVVNASDTIAGYNKALDAVYDTIAKRTRKPKILGPETIGIGYNSVENYGNAMDLSKLHGIGHHLYHGVDENNPYASTDFSKVGDFHPEIPHFQTEYSRGDWFALAGLIYKSFYDEQVVAYLYWDLIWNTGGLVTLDNPWDSQNWVYPKGFQRTKDFYAFKQFSAFIHPGWQMIGHTLTGSSHASLTFLSPGGDSATCVLINRSNTNELQVHVDVPGFRIVESAIYATSASENCTLKGALMDSVVTVSPRSIVTLEMRLTAYDPADDTEAPTIPLGLSIIDSTGNTLSISWDSSTDNIGVEGYHIYLDGNLAGTSGSSSFTIAGLQPNTSYEITISAFDLVPNESLPSSPVSGTTTGPDTEAPTTPTNLSVASVTTNSIELVWDASEDNVGVSGYHIYADGLLKGTAASNGFTLTQLAQATTYQISVSAFDAASNESLQSEPVAVTTKALPDEQPPTIPVNVNISATTQTTISLDWIHSIDNVGVTGYRVFVDGLVDGTTATNSYTILQLDPNTTYEIAVSAFDAASNESAQSMPVTGKTKAGPDIVAPLLQATDSLYAEGYVEVISSEDGMVYLVPEGTSSDLSIIMENSIDSSAVMKDALLNFPIAGLENGNYWLFAVDEAGNISEPEIITISGVGIARRMPDVFNLYPNPFSKEATLRFTLDDDQHIKLTILDSQGRVARAESLGFLPPGDRSVTIQRGALKTGLYFFKLESANGEHTTGRLMVED